MWRRNKEEVFRPGIRRACADLMGECHSGEFHIVRRVTQSLALVKYVFFVSVTVWCSLSLFVREIKSITVATKKPRP